MSNKKSREVENEGSASEEDMESDEDRASDVDSEGNYIGEEEIQTEFEGRNPEVHDFEGIKTLLRQLFLKTGIDLSGLADIIISQNYIGSVVKQCLDDEMEDDEEDCDDDNNVYGITTVINITTRKEEKSIQQLRNLLTTLANDNADDRTKALVEKVLSDDSKHVGLVINERLLSIPKAISVPVFHSLQSELERAQKKNMPYSFQYLIWICKTFSGGADETPIFANPEETPLATTALASFDVDVSELSEMSAWEEGCDLTPYRKVLILDGNKVTDIIKIIRDEAGQA